VSGSLSSDDTGSPATGEWLGTLTLFVDDALGINDGLILSHSRTIDDPAGPAQSRSTSATYSVPYGWWTANLLYSESAYGSVVQGITQDFTTTGLSRTTTLRADRVAYRDQSRKLTFYTGLTRRDTENFVAGVQIGASSRALALLDVSSNLSVASGGSLWSFDAGVSRGLSWLGGLDDASGSPGNAPRAQFTKFTAGAGVTRGFEPFGVRAQLSSTFAGQWSNDVLYSSEQIAIAGPFAVRGYRDERLFGDRGRGCALCHRGASLRRRGLRQSVVARRRAGRLSERLGRRDEPRLLHREPAAVVVRCRGSFGLASRRSHVLRAYRGELLSPPGD
jgi:hemolysin activation/secretion protein